MKKRKRNNVYWPNQGPEGNRDVYVNKIITNVKMKCTRLHGLNILVNILNN